jgi:hypothetical protein
MNLSTNEARQRINEIKPVYAEWQQGDKQRRIRVIGITRQKDQLKLKPIAGKAVLVPEAPGLFDDGAREA